MFNMKKRLPAVPPTHPDHAEMPRRGFGGLKGGMRGGPKAARLQELQKRLQGGGLKGIRKQPLIKGVVPPGATE